MKSLTPDEKALLDILETHAARLNTLGAMLDLFMEGSPFSGDHPLLNPQAQQKRRLRSVLFLDALSDLIAYYHQDALCAIQQYYKPD